MPDGTLPNAYTSGEEPTVVVFGKGRENLEGDWTNHIQANQSDFGLVSTACGFNALWRALTRHDATYTLVKASREYSETIFSAVLLFLSFLKCKSHPVLINHECLSLERQLSSPSLPIYSPSYSVAFNGSWPELLTGDSTN